MDRCALFGRFTRDFVGLDREDPVYTFNGAPAAKRRVYLDTTATSLMPRVVWDGLADYFEHACANSHTEAHRAGRATTHAIEDSRDAIGRLVGYDPERDVVLFTSNGATGAVNFLARALFPPELRPLIKRFGETPPAGLVDAFRSALGASGADVVDELLRRPKVITTCMEHHSNLLPWMEAVGHHNVHAAEIDPDSGALDMQHLEQLLAEHGERTRLVTVTGVSNVTGIVNPVHDIAALAHRYGAQIMVDGAQWIPHAPVQMHAGAPERAIDFLVLSGHKLYAPGSRGALIGSLCTLDARRCVTDVGGGMVEYVTIEDFELKSDVTAREEAGTPNIPGSIAMGLIAEALLHIGMDTVAEAEHALTERLLARLTAIPGVIVYGSTNTSRVPRAGVVAFDVEGLPHGLVAAFLNDFHNIAVRDGCFCAHPYIKRLLRIDPATEQRYRRDMSCGDRRSLPGMVRASLGVYSTGDDIDALGVAIEDLLAHRDVIATRYEAQRDGTFVLRDAKSLPGTFEVASRVERWLAAV